MQSTPERGDRSGSDGHKKKRGSKVHVAVETLGHLLALVVTPADEQELTQVAALAEQVQVVRECSVQMVFIDQGYTGENAVDAAQRKAFVGK